MKHISTIPSIDDYLNENLNDLWFEYNKIENKIAERLGRSANIVSEYSEYIVSKFYGADLSKVSNKCYDFIDDNGHKYQVKARKEDNKCTQIGVIRSWDFDFLIIILFEKNGYLKQALKIPVEVAKKHMIKSTHQNGHIISTTSKLMNDSYNEDITAQLQNLIDNDFA